MKANNSSIMHLFLRINEFKNINTTFTENSINTYPKPCKHL